MQRPADSMSDVLPYDAVSEALGVGLHGCRDVPYPQARSRPINTFFVWDATRPASRIKSNSLGDLMVTPAGRGIPTVAVCLIDSPLLAIRASRSIFGQPFYDSTGLGVGLVPGALPDLLHLRWLPPSAYTLTSLLSLEGGEEGGEVLFQLSCEGFADSVY